MSQAISVRRDILDWLRAEALLSRAQECCGLLAGVSGVISAVFPARNALASPVAFEIAPEDLFAIFRSQRAAGLEHLGIYHSHPSGPETPSPTDIERAYYPAAAYFILTPRPRGEATVRAFTIHEGLFAELNIKEV